MATDKLTNGLVEVKFFEDERIEITQLVQLPAGTRHEISRDQDGEPKLESFYRQPDGTVRPAITEHEDKAGDQPPGDTGTGSAVTSSRTFFGLKLH